MSKLQLPRLGVTTTRKGHSIARNFGSKGSAVSEVSERSDQPRCCGNPSWTVASGQLRRLACTALFKLYASAAISKISCKFRGIYMLQCDTIAARKAPSKGKRLKSMPRIILPNNWGRCRRVHGTRRETSNEAKYPATSAGSKAGPANAPTERAAPRFASPRSPRAAS